MSENPARDYNLPLRQHRRDREKFTCIVYSLLLLFLVISLCQWIPLLLLSDVAKFIQDYPYISVIWLTVALVSCAIFVFFETIRLEFPINWIFTIVIVEGLILGITQAIVAANLTTFAAAFGVVLIYTIILLIISVALTHDLTLDVIIMFVFALILFIASLFFIMLYFLTGFQYYSYIFAVFIFITVSMFIMYHCQTICGNRFAEMRVRDYLLAALILYHHFVILFIVVFYLMWKLAVFEEQESSDNAANANNTNNNNNNNTTATRKSLKQPPSLMIVCRNSP